MLQLYDKNKNKIKGLTKYKDFCIESVLKTGDKTLSFLYPSKFIDGIVEEGYIRNKTDEFVIKEMADRGDWTSIKAQMNVEDLEGKAWEHFNTTEQTIENCLNLACAGTGWTVQVNNVSKKRTVKKTNCSSWDLIQEAKKIYRVEIEFDTLNKIIYVKEKQGQDKGTYFTEDLNLKKLDIESNSYDFYTKIIAIGKENIKVEVENFQYSNKVKTLIWKDERYTVLENLREDATAKLQELSKPRKSYSADVIDLAKLNSKYKNILDYKLGDTITLISKDKKIREKQRIVKIVEYPDEPERNSCEIANSTLDFIDIQKEFQDTADTVNNITEDNGTISEEAIKVAVKNLTIDKADINSLNAAVARIGTLEATKANITELNAVNAKITNLQVNKANITDLTATNIKFDVASGGTLDLQTLLSKFVTGENGQFLNLTTDNVTISNALIKDVIAKSISVEDLKASTISTNKFKIASDNGGIEIVGATQQFKDKNNKVRIQMGQDTQGNFNFILRGEDGTTTLIDHTGIKEKAIADDLIKEKMIAENAVGEKQINYSSLVTGLNKDANTSLIQASKVAIDLTGQKLDVAFNSLKSTVNDTKSKTESNTTSIGVINGQIDTLIKDTIIEENGTTVKLKDSYSTLKQTVNGINATVASHTSSITNLGTNLTNAQNTANSANSLADSKAKVFTSTPTTPYKIGDIWTGGPSGEIMKCKVARASGAYVASDWEKASKYTDDTKANAVEGNLNTLSGKVTTVESKQATLEQSLDGFKTTVSSTYATKTDLSTANGNISSLQNRMASAESKITDNAIISTVQSTINTAKTEAINSANSNTSNLLKSYSTTTQMNTAITQSANSVKTEVSNTYLSKGDATNTYATKASMELTSTQLKLDFSSSGGYNRLRNTEFKNGTKYFERRAYSVVGNLTGEEINVRNDKLTMYRNGLQIHVPSNMSSGQFGVDQTFETIVGTQYTFTCWLSGHRSSKEVIIRQSDGAYLARGEYGSTSGGINLADWDLVKISFIATSNTTVLSIYMNSTQSTDGYIWVIEPQIVEGLNKLPYSPHPEEIYSGNTIVDKDGITIYNGAITIKNNANVEVLKGDSSGNLVMKGVFEQYATNTGYKSIGISNNNVNIYDYTRDGDLVGRLGSGTSLLNGRGMVSLNSDAGNILSLGYQTTSTSGVGVFEIDDTKTNFGGIARSGFFENYSMVNYSMINFTGNDKSIALGRVGLSTSNSVYLLGNDAYSSVNIGLFSNSNIGSFNSKAKITNDGLMVFGNINCSGTKNRIILTNNFDGVKLNAYETADCYFGDIGEGKIGEDGLCYIYLDPILLETINTKCNYQVFLSNYGVEENDWCGCIMREKDYFIVKGTPGLKFGWEIKAKQRGYETDRLEREFIEIPEEVEKLEEERNEIDELAYEYLIEYEKELIEIG